MNAPPAATPAPEAEAADPEIAALLGFAPVTHKFPRADGWTAERQQIFIAALAETGSQEQAGHAAGLTSRGAYALRKMPGAAQFKLAWDAAIALNKARQRRTAAAGPAPWAPPVPEGGAEDGPEAGVAYDPLTHQMDEWTAAFVDRYAKKLQQERHCRLAGRIVEADFYVRQLTFLEIALDLGASADVLFAAFKSGEMHVFNTIGTPIGVLLDRVRRDLWREQGEPDRMPAPLLGEHDDKGAKGHRSGHYYDGTKDGDYDEWLARMAALEALHAEAQALWEEKAKADAAEWAERVKRAEGEAWRQIRADEAAWEKEAEGDEEHD